MPLDMQSKLLRVIQNKEVERIGGSKKINVNVRLIAATHRNLEEQVKANQFRLDLLYRLNVFPIRVPPLRERRSDIPALSRHFISKYATEFEIIEPLITDDAIRYLQDETWPGNIRELENLMQRAVILSNGQPITPTLLQFKPGNQSTPLFLSDNASAPTPSTQSEIKPLEDLEKEALIHAIDVTKGNIRKAADALGISRTTFYNKAKKFNLELD